MTTTIGLLKVNRWQLNENGPSLKSLIIMNDVHFTFTDFISICV